MQSAGCRVYHTVPRLDDQKRLQLSTLGHHTRVLFEAEGFRGIRQGRDVLLVPIREYLTPRLGFKSDLRSGLRVTLSSEGYLQDLGSPVSRQCIVSKRSVLAAFARAVMSFLSQFANT